MGFFPSGRRKQLIVHKKLQERFTSILLMQMTFILLVFASIAYYWNLQQRRLLLPVIGTPDAHVIYRSMQLFLLKTIVLIGLAAISMIIFGLYASHKIAGPVAKMAQFLNEIKDGHYGRRIQFRRSDHLEELADIFNDALVALSEAKSLRMEQLNLAKAKLDALETGLASVETNAGTISATVEDLRVLVQRLSV